MSAEQAAGWDCHAHVIGPYDRFPLAADRNQTPPEALLADYLALLQRLGLASGVLVHPSAYGADHSLLLDVLATQPNLRGVVVARPGTFGDLARLRGQGVRAARFSQRSGPGANFPGSASFDDLVQCASALAESGLHAELWTDCKALPALAEQIEKLPVPLVIDHMGGFDVRAGVDEPGFRTLLGLLERGKVYVKLCVYRNVLGDIEAGRPFHEAMVQANPERLVWGSDWPHLRVAPCPDTAALLDVFRSWTDAVTVDRILVANPNTPVPMNVMGESYISWSSMPTSRRGSPPGDVTSLDYSGRG